MLTVKSDKTDIRPKKKGKKERATKTPACVLLELPVDCLGEIFNFFGKPTDVVSCLCVCKDLNRLLCSPNFMSCENVVFNFCLCELSCIDMIRKLHDNREVYKIKFLRRIVVGFWYSNRGLEYTPLLLVKDLVECIPHLKRMDMTIRVCNGTIEPTRFVFPLRFFENFQHYFKKCSVGLFCSADTEINLDSLTQLGLMQLEMNPRTFMYDDHSTLFRLWKLNVAVRRDMTFLKIMPNLNTLILRHDDEDVFQRQPTNHPNSFLPIRFELSRESVETIFKYVPISVTKLVIHECLLLGVDYKLPPNLVNLTIADHLNGKCFQSDKSIKLLKHCQLPNSLSSIISIPEILAILKCDSPKYLKKLDAVGDFTLGIRYHQGMFSRKFDQVERINPGKKFVLPLGLIEMRIRMKDLPFLEVVPSCLKKLVIEGTFEDSLRSLKNFVENSLPRNIEELTIKKEQMKYVSMQWFESIVKFLQKKHPHLLVSFHNCSFGFRCGLSRINSIKIKSYLCCGSERKTICCENCENCRFCGIEMKCCQINRCFDQLMDRFSCDIGNVMGCALNMDEYCPFYACKSCVNVKCGCSRKRIACFCCVKNRKKKTCDICNQNSFWCHFDKCCRCRKGVCCNCGKDEYGLDELNSLWYCPDCLWLSNE